MIIEETHIGQYNEPDFRVKGVVFEAETKEDAALIDWMLENKEQLLNKIYE